MTAFAFGPGLTDGGGLEDWANEGFGVSRVSGTPNHQTPSRERV